MLLSCVVNLLSGLAVIPALTLFFLLAGYPLVSGLKGISPTERMATGILAGLAWILWVVSAVGSFAPLGSIWIMGLLLPAGVILVRGEIRKIFVHDLEKLCSAPGFRWLVLAVLVFFGALLFPLLSRSNLVFFEGSGNHDNIFWLAGADYLIGHSYLDSLPPDLPAFMSGAINFAGWKPGWGRMGAEGYLALASILTGQRTIYSYNWSAAALYLPWVAGVFLILKLFIKNKPGLWMLLTAVLLQPVFIFFYANGNLPNLMGALMGATILIGIRKCLDREAGTPLWPGGLLLVLGVHGLLCSYPEMVPFVGVTALLLIVAFGFRVDSGVRWPRTYEVMMAGLAGFFINPVSTIRAFNGFLTSFNAARIDQQWGRSLFGELTPLQYPLYLVTSAGKACGNIGPGIAVALGILLIAGTVLAIIRSLRPVDTAILFTGYVLLLLYTLHSGFGYGLQKTVQFSGVIVAAFFPAACLEGLRWKKGKFLSCIAIGVLITFFSYATLETLAYSYRSSSRKYITRDMLAVGRKTEHWKILVLSESFQRSYFWTMWANYLFPKSNLIFTTLTKGPAGYLAGAVTLESRGNLSRPEAFFVSEKWAETMDANSPRIWAGQGYALLSKSNRVVEWKGAAMDEGSPSTVTLPSELVLVPHQDSVFRLDLDPGRMNSGPVRIRVSHQVPGGKKTSQERTVGNQWSSEVWVKLTGGVVNTITIEMASPVPEGPEVWHLLNYSISKEIPADAFEEK